MLHTLLISLRSPLQPPATSSLLGTNIRLSTLFSNTLNLFGVVQNSIWPTTFSVGNKYQIYL